MAVYAFCFIVIVLSFSISLNVILAPYDSNFEYYGDTVLSLLALDFQLLDLGENAKKKSQSGISSMKLYWLTIQLLKFSALIFGCALLTLLYKKAYVFERDSEIIDPEK